MGRSGSGKSTLLNILGTLDKQTSGDYKINGQNIENLNDEEITKIRIKDIGFIFQNYLLDQNLKSIENVMLSMYVNDELKGINKKEKALNLLKYVGLENRINHYPKELSGGEQQRVSIARALSNNPGVVIADEPTGNLDENNEEVIFELLKKLRNEGKLVIIVTHSDNILKYATQDIQRDIKKETKNDIFEEIESEFGRTLSPMEYEVINGWLNKYDETLIHEALKEAVFSNAKSLRYITRILEAWTDKGYKTDKDVRGEKNLDNTMIDLFSYDWLDDVNEE